MPKQKKCVQMCWNEDLISFYLITAHDEETDTKFQAYQVDLLSKICDHVGWNAQPDEPHVTNLLR